MIATDKKQNGEDGVGTIDIADFCHELACLRISQRAPQEPLTLSQLDAATKEVYSELLTGARKILASVPSYGSLMNDVNRHVQRDIMGMPIQGECDGMNISYVIPANPNRVKVGKGLFRELQRQNPDGIPVYKSGDMTNVRLRVYEVAEQKRRPDGRVPLKVTFRVTFAY